ncbi:MAG TPA: cell envelope integrity EipB family protein [Xanthobacteraceae bacterium]|jgi:hypothetical protein|nr:cell envelope integrity EipB family protein [Xanthobacteraceae bacterium]
MRKLDGSRLSGLVAAAGIAAILVTGTPVAEAATVPFASHRAIYDLKLAESRGRRPIESVRGRILYDFSGNACDGYALQFRQVSALDSGEGKTALSDLRAVTWEDGAAKQFRFNSQNFLNEQQVDSVDGMAERQGDKVVVKLAKPARKTFDLPVDMVFPTEHMRRIIEEANAGKTILNFPVYDGSETGEKVYNTLTVIGHEIAPGEKKPTDAAAGKAELDQLKRWPVTISYFDQKSTGGEQTPVYAISFELYENGISRALSLDYGDFVVSGEMTELDMKETKPCH